ncbi:MAG: hypothetical protein KAH22_02270 [Thiotrichaceae bacterium]|nr:hypothetical protein [Thiotrichaceae bacterium]
MNEKIAILNDLGDPQDLDIEDGERWPNYLEHGFTEADVTDLIAIVVDEDLYEEPKGKQGRWIHLHTWRTLGQLKAVDAVNPLISTFDFFSMVEDKGAFNELPEVIAMIGEPAIEAVAARLADVSKSTYSRSIANDTLGNIAKKHPHCRDKVLAKYKAYLSAPDGLSIGLNGFVVGQLLDLKAVELIDDIRQLFKIKCIDLSIVGDLEAVEKQLN